MKTGVMRNKKDIDIKREDSEFSVPHHTAHLCGYMDAVGRVLSPSWELVSLSATLVRTGENVDGLVGRIHRRDKIENWSAEFSDLVTNFLCLNERERLGFYLIDLICHLQDFTKDALCFKLDCEPASDRILGQASYLLELEDAQRVLLMFMRSVRVSYNKPSQSIRREDAPSG
jgi:ankyrin repeat protein